MKSKKWGAIPYQITFPTGETRITVLNGRVRWAIEELRNAGRAGRTGKEAMGPRWAAYIHDAKHIHGIPIRDEWEKHGGDHPGKHKRWFLDCEIKPVLQTNGAAK